MITIRKLAYGPPLDGRYTSYARVPAVPGALQMGSGTRTLNVSTTKGAATAEYCPIQGRADRRVPVHHACIRAIAPPYSRNHSICTPAGRRPSTASPCQHQHRRVVGETRSPPRLEHARHGYDRRGRDGQAAGPAASVAAVAELLATGAEPPSATCGTHCGRVLWSQLTKLGTVQLAQVARCTTALVRGVPSSPRPNRYRKTKTSQSV